MSSDKSIQDCVNFLLESHQDEAEWGGGFLEKSEITAIKVLIKKNFKTWTSKMTFNGWKLIEKHQEYLDSFSISFSDISRPDYMDDNDPCNINLLQIKNNKFVILNPDEQIKKQFKSLILPFNVETLFSLYPLIISNTLKLDKEYYKFINIYFNLLHEKDMVNLFNNDVLKNLKETLKPFQAIGALFLLLNKRALLGDEMGLGKTIQALTAIEISNSKPALIVCPNNLKIHWFYEINKILANQKVEILSNKASKDADFYIINYESLHKHISFINEIQLKSIVLDESHYLKNQKTKRVKSCSEVVKNIEYRIALTGTPVLKEPIDLISQLRLLNRFDVFGSETDFTEMYYKSEENKWGKTSRKNTKNLDSLNIKLKENGFLRREKKNVAKFLPNKTKNIVYLEQEGKQYQKIEKEFKNLPNNQKISKLNELKQAAAFSKYNGIIEWINNFKTTDKKLVIFAYHQKMQESLINDYPESAKLIKGMTDTERQNNITKFQEDDNCKLIICSIKAFSTGLTLTASSDVLFAETDWCSATNEQCEDRCHRIGQNNNVNIWYLIAKNTIEEHVLNVVKEKKDLIEKSCCSNEKLNKLYNSYSIRDIIYEL